MRTSERLLPLALVGLLLVLSAGAIALSLASAPPVAKTQLSAAAKNTEAASSFVLTDVNTVTSPQPSSALGGKSSETSTVRIAYQAPDRILEHLTEGPGHTVTLLVVGNDRFQEVGGKWSLLPPTATSATSIGAAEASELLVPPDAVATSLSAKTRTRGGSTYSFVPGNATELLESLFGQQASTVSRVRYMAIVEGEFLRSEVVSASERQFRFTIALGFSSVNSVPPIEPPKL